MAVTLEVGLSTRNRIYGGHVGTVVTSGWIDECRRCSCGWLVRLKGGVGDRRVLACGGISWARICSILDATSEN